MNVSNADLTTTTAAATTTTTFFIPVDQKSISTTLFSFLSVFAWFNVCRSEPKTIIDPLG